MEKEKLKVGNYTLTWVDEDHIEVVSDSTHIVMKTKIVGGDLESLLNCLFMDNSKYEVIHKSENIKNYD